ncbi:MAG: arginase [bacterium]|nr:arginase [bacterium]
MRYPVVIHKDPNSDYSATIPDLPGCFSAGSSIEEAYKVTHMTNRLTQQPGTPPFTFLDFPLADDLDCLDADVAILGIPFGKPYHPSEMANDQSRAPDAIRQCGGFADESRLHYDWDLGGPLLDGRDVKVVDCGNVSANLSDYAEHYRRAENAAKKIFASGATLITFGGDHGVSIPIMRALERDGAPITLIHVDAHLDWRHEVNGETEGYSSPIRRASEMPWFGNIVQIGMRGVGSARIGEVEDARAHGADIITAYELHNIGIESVLDRIPATGPYYLTIDADGLDPTIMPAVLAQTPGGLTWMQIRALIHGLINKGRVLGMDLVEIAPTHDVGRITLMHAERLICNFIGAAARAGYYD